MEQRFVEEEINFISKVLNIQKKDKQGIFILEHYVKCLMDTLY